VVDTLKVASTGVGGFTVMCLEWLPEIVRVGVGIATLVYLVLKIKRELLG
tara:strand:- start:529 stop:678 length:150 start_codon:yes stop_codon:yes gene_type:complete